MTELDIQTRFNVNLPVEIRQARKEDMQQLEWNGQFAHLRNLFARSYSEQRRGRRFLLVATCNGHPIGRLFIQFNGHDTAVVKDGIRGYLYSFHVMEALRGFGIGTRLIKNAESILLERDYDFVTIAVAKDNDRALNLYRRQGYRIYADDPGKWRFRDHLGQIRHVHEPCWLLEKKLHVR